MTFPEPTKIMLAGDWHGNGQWAQKCVHHARKQGADVIVHLGDFGWWVDNMDTHRYLRFLQSNLGQCGITLYWVDGNHECHEWIDEWVEASGGEPWSDKRYPNIVHLPRGFRWQWWDQTWLALGGAHSVDRLQRTPGKSWWDREHISWPEAERAIAGGKVDVMITHDCPDGVDIPGIASGGWPKSEILASSNHRKLLRQVCDEVRPTLLAHGHHHVRYEDLLRYEDGTYTMIQGLADDGCYDLARNTMLLREN